MELYDLWADKQMARRDLKVLDLLTVRQDALTFFPDDRSRLTNRHVPTLHHQERSFSTLRRNKTLTRETMVEKRLSGLAPVQSICTA